VQQEAGEEEETPVQEEADEDEDADSLGSALPCPSSFLGTSGAARSPSDMARHSTAPCLGAAATAGDSNGETTARCSTTAAAGARTQLSSCEDALRSSITTDATRPQAVGPLSRKYRERQRATDTPRGREYLCARTARARDGVLRGTR